MNAADAVVSSRVATRAVGDEAVVRVVALEKTFAVPGNFPWSPRRVVSAVRGVDIQVLRGEVVALVGQSGSGKTTLSRIILGLEAPTAGEVWLEALPWSRLAEAERQRHRIHYQYVPQDAMAALDPQQTVLEHVVETLTVLARKTRAEAVPAAAAMLARLGLSHRHDALPRELSGGEQRRVTLARVLALQPRLVVADEPTSGLDPDRRAAVLEDLVGNLPAAAGCILVTHDLDAARDWCHRAIVMLEGRVIEEIDLRTELPRHPYTRALLDPWQNPSPGGVA
jgi:peptide/nickel transport system ATP-binding protein